MKKISAWLNAQTVFESILYRKPDITIDKYKLFSMAHEKPSKSHIYYHSVSCPDVS